MLRVTRKQGAKDSIAETSSTLNVTNQAKRDAEGDGFPPGLTLSRQRPSKPAPTANISWTISRKQSPSVEATSSSEDVKSLGDAQEAGIGSIKSWRRRSTMPAPPNISRKRSTSCRTAETTEVEAFTTPLLMSQADDCIEDDSFRTTSGRRGHQVTPLLTSQADDCTEDDPFQTSNVTSSGRRRSEEGIGVTPPRTSQPDCVTQEDGVPTGQPQTSSMPAPAMISRKRSTSYERASQSTSDQAMKKTRRGPLHIYKKHVRSMHESQLKTASEYISELQNRYDVTALHPSGVTDRVRCLACKQDIRLHRHSLYDHLLREKHLRNVQFWKAETGKQTELTSFLSARNTMQIQDTRKQQMRTRVLQAFLRQGIAFNRLAGDLKALIEEFGDFTMGNPSKYGTYIPSIHDYQVACLVELIAQIKLETAFTIIFDSTTTRCGHAFCVVIRYVTKVFNIEHRLINFRTLQAALTSDAVGQIIVHLTQKFSIPFHSIAAFLRDRATVNDNAVSGLRRVVTGKYTLDLTCVAHTLDLCGRKVDVPNLQTLTSHLITLFVTSQKANVEWRTMVGVSWPSFSKTRWWSRWEIQYHMAVHFPQVCHFLDITTAGERTILKAAKVAAEKRTEIMVELAVIVDVGLILCPATYFMEGDGPLVVYAFDTLMRVFNTLMHEEFLFNTRAVCRNLGQSEGNWMDYARELLQPLRSYLNALFCNGIPGHSSLVQSMDVYKAARLFHPGRVQYVEHDQEAIEFMLENLPVTKAMVSVNDLLQEMPIYLQLTAECPVTVDVLAFWRTNEPVIPHFGKAARAILTYHTTSAAGERVFSLMSNYLNETQLSTLDDKIETQLMLQFNSSPPLSSLMQTAQERSHIDWETCGKQRTHEGDSILSNDDEVAGRSNI